MERLHRILPRAEPGLAHMAWGLVVCGSLAAWSPPAAGQCVQNEAQKLIASDGTNAQTFGTAVAVSGDLAVVGSYGHAHPVIWGSGAAYVYRYDGTAWQASQLLKPTDLGTFASYGWSVAADGDVVVVGTREDTAYVYRDNGTSLVLEQKLTPALPSKLFGGSVAVSGDVVVCGAEWDSGNMNSGGAAHVFRFDGSAWQLEEKLYASDAQVGDRFGWAVAADGDLIAVSAGYHWHPSALEGSVYVYRYDAGLLAWQEEAELPNPDPGFDYGMSVATSGDLVVIGEARDWIGVTHYGAAFVHRHDPASGSWSLEQKLTMHEPESSDFFGTSVSVSGDAILVGSPGDGGPSPYGGSASLFRHVGGGWMDAWKLVASDSAVSDKFGAAVGLDGDVAIVAAIEDDEPGQHFGSAYAFGLPATPTVYCTAKPTSIAGCLPAFSTAGVASLSGGGFDVTWGQAPGANIGLFVYSTQGSGGSPISTAYGWLCIDTTAMFRTDAVLSGGTTGACDGAYTLDFVDFALNQTANPGLGAGSTVDLQCWYRDPPNTGAANLSSALRFALCP